MLLPLPVRLVDGKALEQPEPGGEERFQGRDRKRLPEPARTRDEEKVGADIANHAMQEHRLVDVDASLVSQLRKIVRVCGYWSQRTNILP